MSKFKPILDRPPKTRGLDIKLYADVSTGHLTREDLGLLEGDAAKSRNDAACRSAGVNYTGGHYLGVVDYPEGFVVWLGRASSKAYISGFLQGYKERGYSSEFCEILRRAMEAGCASVILDQDGSTIDDLE